MAKARGRVETEPPAAASRPVVRHMTVVAQDPSVRARPGAGPILMATIAVPAEDLAAGPIGYRVHVVDYDATARRFHGAHVLPPTRESEPRAWGAGDPRILSDHRFHAQNVYALVMKTLARFEFALGRRVGWSFGTHQIKVAPHGMLDANAFYSPGEEGLVFGYFRGRTGAIVHTCLSHDVVVHETTHALVDALRERYLDPSSPDQAAFHEGFADVIALLSVFSQPELVRRLLLPRRREATTPALVGRHEVTPEALRRTALFGLAEEMGDEMEGVRGGALRRSALLAPDATLLEHPEFLEPHRRGEVFVAAVMNGFIRAWADRVTTSGVPGQQQYPAARVAEEGADIADTLGTMWIRALDYMPPVHLEFPDALSAALSADREARPDDSRFRLRRHMLETFRAYGIRPASARKDPVGAWDRAPGGLRYDRVRFEPMRTDKDEVFRFLWENREALSLRSGAYTEVLSVRPCVRVGIDGFILRETVAEYYQVARLTPAELRRVGIEAPREYLDSLRKEQRRARAGGRSTADAGPVGEDERPRPPGADDGTEATTPLYGGGVLVFDEYGHLKYHVHNDVFGKRQARRLRYLWESGLLEPGKDGARLRTAHLAALHRLRAVDARRFPAQDW